jgi:RNA polymerase-binding transcription factor DksA
MLLAQFYIIPELVNALAVTIWSICLFEIMGLVDSNFCEPVGKLLILYNGVVLARRIGIMPAEPPTDDKLKRIDNFFGRLSTELNKVIEDHELLNIHSGNETKPKPPPPTPEESSSEEENLPYSNEEIQKQYEFIKKMSRETDRIAENLLNISNTDLSCCNPDHVKECVRCGVDEDSILECTIGFDYHEFKCGICSQPNRGRTRSRHYNRDPSRSRSRSRDREENTNCEHVFERVVRGYDDKYSKCKLCGYEIPR